MKKPILLLCCIILFSTTIRAQYVSIPDPAFRSFLKSRYPSCFNGADMMDTTCNSILAEDTLGGFNSYPSLGVTTITNLEGVQYFKSIKYLCIDGAAESTGSPLKIPSLPGSLVYLSCYYNNIISLPSLPPLLDTLFCGKNKLKSLPDLPSSLKHLICFYNELTSLPPLPNKLRYLDCQSNQINSISYFPSKLSKVNCGGNNLTSLPPLPASLYILYCSSNFLSELPPLPQGIDQVSFTNNDIHCLPFLPNGYPHILYLEFDTSKIHCIPNSFPNLKINSSYILPPLCSPVNNVEGCKSKPVIEGKIFYDYNKNSIKDNDELYTIGYKVELSNNNYAFTDNNGFYQLSADTTGSVTLLASPLLYSIAVPGAVVFNFTTYDTTVVQNFAIQPVIVKDSLSVTAVPVNSRARPGFPYPYIITYRNEGSTNLSPTIRFNYDNQILDYNSSSNPSVSKTGNILTLNVPSLPYGGSGSFIAYFTVKTTAPIGDTLCVWTSASAKTVTAYNDACNVIITGSYDPNDKQSTPILSPEQVSKGGYINYTIRFQNTGNDTAFTVVIADTLSNKLQTNTLQMICASHLCKATVKDSIAYFEFLNILLPDSNVNEPASHGFVQFRVKPQSNLTLNSQVENKSYIYFDYNKPALTNTAITLIKDLPLPISLLSFTGSLQGNQTNLNWQTTNEVNFSRFEIERSTDGIRYTKIGTAVAKNTRGNSDYNFIDSRLTVHDSHLYYRLKIIDKDGSTSYSAVVLVILNKDKFSVLISPDPGNGKFSIQLFNWNSSNGSVRITDMNGRMVYQKESIGRNGSTLPIDIQHMAKGLYMVTINGEGQKIVQKVIVQ